MDTYTISQIVMFLDIEQEALGDELTVEANIAAVAAGTGMSGNTDGLRKLISAFQGRDVPATQVDPDLQRRLDAFLSKKRADARPN